jgi:two-component system sensor histidine kinase KdpD
MLESSAQVVNNQYGEHDLSDKCENQSRQQLLAIPIVSPPDRLIGVIRLRNKRQYDEPKAAFPLNRIDEQRAHRAGEVLAPLLRLVAERQQRDDMLRRIRHDLRMPATMIRDVVAYYGKLYRDSPETFNQKVDHIFGQKLHDCQSMCELILISSDMAQLSSADEIDLRLQEPADLFATVVKPVCKILHRRARQRGLQEVHYSSERFFSGMLPKLWVDAALIRVVLFNLIDNAIKYSDAGSRVKVSTNFRNSPDRYCITVLNHGIGIPVEESSLIFDPYYRALSAKRVTISGVGLGLSIARSIMRRHGGDVALVSHEPTIFAMEFPFCLATERPS